MQNTSSSPYALQPRATTQSKPTQQLQSSAKVHNQLCPAVKRAPPKETHVTHARSITSVLEACVASSICCGGLSDFCLTSSFSSSDYGFSLPGNDCLE